ncbi:MAG: hypothetical protein LN569_04295 [Rickettsia endosymbiont of Labidopullus appendiculatus]|nr:hypothetical protein [Rickettsia endosymbiont of Labidopullus appendiculatus]
MSKHQEYNATSTSEETTEAQRKKHEEFLGHLEKSRAELEEKSVEEIKKLSTLELAKYFCDDYLLIRDYQEYSQTYSDPSFSEEQKHDLDIYLKQHSKPDIEKFIAAFDTLKTKVSQLQQCTKNSSTNFTIWIEPIMGSMNDLQNLNPEDIENMINNMVPVVAGFKQLLKNPSLQEPLTAWEMVISKGGKDAVTNLTEEDKAIIAVSEEELELELSLFQVSHKIDRLKEEEKVLEQKLQGEDVPTTGSSDLVGDDLA